MTTTDRDFIRWHSIVLDQDVTFQCVKVGLEWPPPERIVLGDVAREAQDDDDPQIVLHRVRMSEWTDEMVLANKHLGRGAEYEYRELVGA